MERQAYLLRKPAAILRYHKSDGRFTVFTFNFDSDLHRLNLP